MVYPKLSKYIMLFDLNQQQMSTYNKTWGLAGKTAGLKNKIYGCGERDDIMILILTEDDVSPLRRSTT